jgi:hypothetical protein
LKFAIPNGIPMIVRHNSAPVTMWPSASHQPHNTNQMTFAIADPAPAPGFFTTVRPKGHRAKIAIRSAATPNGIVMIRTKQISAAIT